MPLKLKASHLFLLAFVCFSTSYSAVSAQELKATKACFPVGTRFITVNGSGEIEALPNRAKVVIAVRSWDKNVNTASTKNASSMNAMIALAAKYHIDSKDIQTSRLDIQPTYPAKQGINGKPEGYQVYRSLTVIFKNMDDVPGLIAEAIDAGANSIESISFDLDDAQLHKYENDASAKATETAGVKAEVIAKQLNAKIGKALIIREGGVSVTNLNAQYERTMPKFDAAMLAAPPMEAAKVAPGQLKINSYVTITYELVDQ